MTDSNLPFVSLVIPVFNEQENLASLLEEIDAVMKQNKYYYELICVDDGSTDESLNQLKLLKENCAELKIISLSRNFGKERALTAGLEHTKGQVVIPIDADLQHPPSVIPEMIEKWHAGYKMVIAICKDRLDETWFKKFGANLFYKSVNSLCDFPVPQDGGDFRLIDRSIIEAIKQMPERNRFMKGIFAWTGFKQTLVYFERNKRVSGDTKWNYFNLWKLALDGLFSLTSFPLKIWTYVGFCISGFAFIYALVIILKTVFFSTDVPGYASLITTVLFLGGIQLISLGVLGEYIARIYEETKQRPLYIISEIYE